MKLIVATVVAGAVLSLAGAAHAQTAAFKCPATGTEFTYKTSGPDSIVVATGQEGSQPGNVCLSRSTSGGRTATVRVHWGLIGSVDPAGESFVQGIDLKSLWPLKVGNRTTQTVSATGRDGKAYSSTVTMTVAAFEKVTVPAGTFDAFRVEETKAGEATPRIHWWAPSLAISVKETFPDWTDRSKLKVYELSAVKPAAK
jgi:hypothetical protein